MAKKKTPQKPSPKMTGAGMLRTAAEKATERNKKRDCIIDGGEWVPGVGCVK